MSKKKQCITWLCLLFMAIVASFAACGTRGNAYEGENYPDYGYEAYPDYINNEIVAYEAPVAHEASVLPSLHITIDARDIHRHDWQEVIVSLDGSDYEFDETEARIRGRGNSTWRYMGEKRPFRIRFDTARPMFGSDYAARDWVFLANAIDYSMMRNYAAYYLAYLFGRAGFAPARHFVHVYTNGEYRGVYMLSDQVQVHYGRVDITLDRDPALSEYLIEWCRHHKSPDDVYFVVNGIPFVIKHTSSRYETDGHVAFASEFITQIDTAIRSLDFETLEPLICVPSFVDLYLVNEFTKNADVSFSSLNFTIRRRANGTRLVAGPIWDFDQSAGGSYAHWYPDYSPRRIWAALSNTWFAHMILIPEFRDEVARRWYEVRDDQIVTMIERLEELAAIYRACFERNFERWPDKLGNYLWRTPATVVAIPTFVGQVEYLTDWFRQRAVWMDGWLL